VALVLLVALAAVPLGVWLVVIVPDSRMVMVPVVLVDLLGWVLVIGWRVSFPRRATRTLVALGAGKDGDRPRLRRIWRRGPVWHLAWRMPPGVTVTALARNSEAVEQALDCSVEWWYDRRLVHMRAGVKRLPESIEWSRFHGGSVVHEVPRVLSGWLLRIGGKRLRPLLGELVGAEDGVGVRRRELSGELPLVIGMSREGPKVMDLVELPHVLVGGVPGGGKSVFLRQALVGLLARFGPDRVRLALADFKGRLEFAIFAGVPHLLGPVAGDMVSFAALMQQVMAELDQRQGMFEASGVEKIQRWNEAKPDQRLPYVVVAVEEIADVSAAEAYAEDARRVAKKDALSALARLCRVGRALGST
jgi:FtsK/SpoIIIE family